MLLLILRKLVVTLALDWQSTQFLVDNTTHVVYFTSIAWVFRIRLALVLLKAWLPVVIQHHLSRVANMGWVWPWRWVVWRLWTQYLLYLSSLVIVWFWWGILTFLDVPAKIILLLKILCKLTIILRLIIFCAKSWVLTQAWVACLILLESFVALAPLLFPLIAWVALLDKIVYLRSVTVRFFIVTWWVVSAMLWLNIAASNIAIGVTCCRRGDIDVLDIQTCS